MKRVLLIDDEESMEPLLSLSLRRWGVTVDQVTDCAAAVSSAVEDPPDLILLDLALGHDDGMRLLPELRREEALQEVPIVIFSVHESRRREALAAGADGFISKPFSERGIHSVLEPFLS